MAAMAAAGPMAASGQGQGQWPGSGLGLVSSSSRSTPFARVELCEANLTAVTSNVVTSAVPRKVHLKRKSGHIKCYYKRRASQNAGDFTGKF